MAVLRGIQFAGASRKPCLYGVFVDIAKGDGELPDAIKNPRVKSVTPEMPGKPSSLIVGSRDKAKKSMHDRRKILVPAGLDLQVYMIPHNAKVGDLEAVALFCAREKNQK